MREFTVVLVPQDLLPQVVGELLGYAADPNLVEVVYGEKGREIHAHPEVAEAWFSARTAKKEEAKSEEAEAPLAATPPNVAATAAAAVAKKKTTSASRNSEES